MSDVKTPSERGVIGAWAFQARQELGLSVEQVAERVGGLGQAVSPATIRGIESGNKPPGRRLLRLLARALESVPPGATQEPGPPTDATRLFDALTRALEAQARYLTQIEDLRAELAQGLEDAQRQREAQAQLLGRLSAELGDLRDLVGKQAGSWPTDRAGRDRA